MSVQSFSLERQFNGHTRLGDMGSNHYDSSRVSRVRTKGRLMKHIGYSRDAWGPQSDLVHYASEKLKNVNYDSMVGTGLSGSLVIPVMAPYFKKDWAIIRKSTENSHSQSLFEGIIGKRWIFVDDGVSTGLTLLRVVQTVKQLSEQYGEKNEFIGAYMYGPREWAPADELTSLTENETLKIMAGF